MTLLILTPFLPFPLRSGGQIKIFNSLKGLSKKYDILLLSFIENLEQEKHIPELNKLCKKVSTVLRRPPWYGPFYKIHLPLFVKRFYSTEMKEKLKTCLKNYDIDLVQIEYINMAGYAEFIPGIPKILVEHDPSIYTLTQSYERPLLGWIFHFFNWINWRRFQKMIYPHFDKIVAFSEEDSQIIQKAAEQDKIATMPVGIDLASYTLAPDDEKTIDILFIGHMRHYPNRDGLNYFKRKILPLIKKEIPDIKFYVIGSDLEREVPKISDETIKVIGDVEDMRPYLSKAKVLVAPVRLGGGIKVKILEAMAMGVPVIATVAAARGLKVVSGRDIYIVGSSRDYANKVVTLLKDRAQRMEMARNAREVVERYYDASKLAYQEEALCRSLTPCESMGGKRHFFKTVET